MSCCPPTVLCSFDNSCIPSPVLRTPASIYTFFSLPHPLLSAITFSNLLWFITWPIQMLHFFAVFYTKTTKKINSLKNLFVFIYIINYDSRCTCTSSICLKFFFQGNILWVSINEHQMMLHRENMEESLPYFFEDLFCCMRFGIIMLKSPTIDVKPIYPLLCFAIAIRLVKNMIRKFF